MGVNLDVFVRALAYATFVLALLTNALLILLALKKTSRDFGAYKYIMLCFGLFNILYSLTELLTQPADLIASLIFIFCMCIAHNRRKGGTTQTRSGPHNEKQTKRPRRRYFFYRVEWIILWIVIMLGWGSIYGLIAYYAYAPSEAFYEFARHEVLTQLDRNIDYLTFFCVFPYERIDGVTKVHWRYCLGLFCCIMMMIITVIVIVYCGVQTIRMLRKACMSPKTLFLHKQLLKALFAQVCIITTSSKIAHTGILTIETLTDQYYVATRRSGCVAQRVSHNFYYKLYVTPLAPTRRQQTSDESVSLEATGTLIFRFMSEESTKNALPLTITVQT
ncbi:7TM chemoreceptor [Ancylostoma ceylanicum]|uniref:7TM chemoreceptor n=1 Tax=Ancylostoma ceylanicum TaxID=53326 RepID=A0A0D6LMM9_9BILA|nr:7TM chemoreceptor [Ancylostoma ceylanicum]